MALSREEFMRQMGISKDDVADPEIVVANKKESAQSSYFANKAGPKKVFPGYASATPPAPQPLSEEGAIRYDKYVNARVDNVTNGRVDSQDEPYMRPTSIPKRVSDTEAPTVSRQSASRQSIIKDDWISETPDEPPAPPKVVAPPVVDDTEALYTRKKNTDGLSVAQRIAQSSLQFYGAGDSDQDEAPQPKNKAVPTGQPTDSRSRAEFLKSLGIENTGEYVAKSKASAASASGALGSSKALSGADRTEALSQAVAARRMQRKAGQASKTQDSDEPAYIPPRSAPTAMAEEPAPRQYTSTSNAASLAPASNMYPRASSEPSGDQRPAPRGQRVTINEPSRPMYPTSRQPEAYVPEVESPKKIVNDLLYGGKRQVEDPVQQRSYNAAPPRSPYEATQGKKDGSSSSFNDTLNRTTNSAEYDPETAGMSPEELKILGNKAFENGDFRKAVRYYSKAINKDSANAALYSNRSAAYLQASKQMGMDTRSMALRDAEKTIELNPKWFKGYSRKGDTLFKMDKFDDAIEAYETGLRYDEGNPSLIHSIGEARNANGGIASRDKKDTPWAVEQKTSVDYKKAFANRSAHELVDSSRGELNDALGTLVMGDEYRKQQLERFKTKDSVRASGTRPAAPPQNAPEQAASGGNKSLLDMIRSNSPKEVSIPVMASSSASGGAGYGRRKDIPESLTSGAAAAYQDSLMERYLARKAAK